VTETYIPKSRRAGDHKSRWIIKFKEMQTQNNLKYEIVLKVRFSKPISLDEALEILGIDPRIVNEAC